MTRGTNRLPPGEIPEGRAKLFLSLYAYARQRTLEPVLEPGVTRFALPLLDCNTRTYLLKNPDTMPSSGRR